MPEQLVVDASSQDNPDRDQEASHDSQQWEVACEGLGQLANRSHPNTDLPRVAAHELRLAGDRCWDGCGLRVDQGLRTLLPIVGYRGLLLGLDPDCLANSHLLRVAPA